MIASSSSLLGIPVTAELAGIFEDGSALLAETFLTSSRLIEPVHFMVVLARTNRSLLRRDLLERYGVDVEMIVDYAYADGLDTGREPGVVTVFERSSFSSAAQTFIDDFAGRVVTYAPDGGTEALFLSTLLD